MITVRRRSLRGRDSGPDGGAVAIEFALLMAFLPLTIFVFGIVDYGNFMEQATNLTAMIRGAAEYARGAVVGGGDKRAADGERDRVSAQHGGDAHHRKLLHLRRRYIGQLYGDVQCER